MNSIPCEDPVKLLKAVGNERQEWAVKKKIIEFFFFGGETVLSSFRRRCGLWSLKKILIQVKSAFGILLQVRVG